MKVLWLPFHCCTEFEFLILLKFPQKSFPLCLSSFAPCHDGDVSTKPMLVLMPYCLLSTAMLFSINTL